MAPHSTAHESAGTAFDASLINEILAHRPHEFLQPSQDIHASVLALSKSYFDPIASQVSSTQLDRLKAERRGRKRKRRGQDTEEEILRIKSLTVDGFDAEQVWAQARRISGAVRVEVDRFARQQQARQLSVAEDESSDDEVQDEEAHGMPRERLEDDLSAEGEADGLDVNEDDIDLNADIGDYDSDSSDEDEHDDIHSANLVQDRFGLNDGFFSIDEFNRRTEMLEQQDFRGEPDLEAASDEEDLDYEMDPMSVSADKSINKRGKPRVDVEDDLLAVDEDEEQSAEEEEEAGPTFGDMDLNAPEGASDDEVADEDEADEGLSQPLMYKDFFDAPARKSASKQGKKSTRSRDSEFDRTVAVEDLEADITRAMSAVHRDIFSDNEEEEQEEEAEEPEEALTLGKKKQKQPDQNLSSHEKRKAEILSQIRELEARLVAKRPWVLAGEAKASDRLQHALLEEHLDFERTGKPLPVVTKETSEEIEELIKRRILAGEFDEVRKRRPGEDLDSPFARRGRRALDQELETPRQKGLADVYEEEHLRKNDPAYVDKRTEKLKKEHAEIEAMWKDVSHKLDSLASFRYRPKPTDVTISVRSDAPAMRLEDARPSGVGGNVGSMDQLAPQEIYVPGEAREKGKVVTKGGTVIDQAELSREERKRRRKREKERAKKAGAQKDASATAATAARNVREAKSRANGQTQAQIAGDLKRGGVKIIGRKGELRDVEGNDVKENVHRSAGSFKL